MKIPSKCEQCGHKVREGEADVRQVALKRYNRDGSITYTGPVVNWCKPCRGLRPGGWKYEGGR